MSYYEETVLRVAGALCSFFVPLYAVGWFHRRSQRVLAARERLQQLNADLELRAIATERDKFAVTWAFDRARSKGRVAILPTGLGVQVQPEGRHCTCGELCRPEGTYCSQCGSRLSYTVE